ncbi:hypothetical protein BDV06DRAFT_183508, partial [Aspergillus oleicola]
MSRIPLLVNDNNIVNGEQPHRHTVVNETREAVLGRPTENMSEDSPFFETWVGEILAVNFVNFYQERGITVEMEDVLGAPTKRSQRPLV